MKKNDHKINFKWFVLLFIIYSLGIQSQSLKIQNGPYLQYVTENEATIIWTTNKESISWVEYYIEDGSNFYAKERTKVHASEHGLKTIGKIHKVNLSGLEEGTKYAYRIYSKEVIAHKRQNSLFGNTVATRVYKKQPLYFNTLETVKPNTSLLFLTDVHENSDKIGKLLDGIDFSKTDFVVLNGDFMNNFDEESNLFEGSIDTLASVFAKEIPLYIVRGNHETRGVMAAKLIDYFYFPDNKYYYTFQYGETIFLVLDGGEDKADSDIEYSSLADFDSYRTQEAIWLKKVVNSDEFKNAKHRIVFSHIPPYGGGSWHGDIELQKKFVPILNKANIDLMICGHTHRNSFVPVKKGKNAFPILICGSKAKVRVDINPNKITTTTIDLDNKIIAKQEF